MTAGLAAAGPTLARLVSARAVCGYLGASALPAVPRALAGRALGDDEPPAAVAIWLLIGGAAVAIDRGRRALGAAWEPLAANGLIVIDGAMARATAAIVGLGAGLVVGDRLDAPAAAPWPDDSSLHLLGALPSGRLGAWLDVGTGAAIAPLAAGPRAQRVRACDLAPGAIARATTGVALSGRAEVELVVADLLDGAGPGWDLITFNAPVPAEHGTEAIGASGWRRAPAGAAVLERFWATVDTCAAPGAEIIVHSAIADDPWRLHAGRSGTATIARYTPPGRPGFAITRWQPDGPDERRLIDVGLDRATPFVTRAVLTSSP